MAVPVRLDLRLVGRPASGRRRTLIRFRPQPWPTLIAGLGVALCVALGLWQLERREWKEALLAQIAANRAAAPVAVEAVWDTPPAALAYRPAIATGVFDHSRERHLYAARGQGEAGFDIVTPLRLADGRFVLVNRGYVPNGRKDPATRPAGQLPGTVTVTGLLRASTPASRWTPADDPARNIWFHRDVARMAATLGPGAQVFPVFLDAGPDPNPGGWPQGGGTRLKIPNNHLSYAFQWFSFAFVLAIIYVVWHVRAGRLAWR